MRISSVLACSALLTLSACYYAPPPRYGYAPPPQAGQTPPPGNCHEMTQTIIVDGQPQQGISTLCQQPDGSWGPAATQQAAAGQYPAPEAYGYGYPYYYAAPSYDGYYPAYGYGFYDPLFIGGFGFGFGGGFFDRFHTFHHFGGGRFHGGGGGHFAGGGHGDGGGHGGGEGHH